MKKVIKVEDLCCERCAKGLARKLELVDGVLKAKANFKRNTVFVEVKSSFSDEALRQVVVGAGYAVTDISLRKGLFA